MDIRVFLMLVFVLIGGCGNSPPDNSNPPPDEEIAACGDSPDLTMDGPDGGPGFDCTAIRTTGHAGGNAASNACADRWGPNDFWTGQNPGSGDDAKVGCVSYDGIRLARNPQAGDVDRVWEMKVLDWNNYTNGVKMFELVRERKQLRTEVAVAAACGIRLEFVTTNAAHWQAVVDMVQDMVAKGEIPDYPNFDILKYQGCPEAPAF